MAIRLKGEAGSLPVGPRTLANADVGHVYERSDGQFAYWVNRYEDVFCCSKETGEIIKTTYSPSEVNLGRYVGPAPRLEWD